MIFFRKNAKKPSNLSAIETERKMILNANNSFFTQEAYKALRTKVTFALAAEDECKVFIVTSSMQSEGKSMTALNLAISYAMAEQRVLLIDCDLRRPKLARLLDAKSQVGLSNLLMKPSILPEVIYHTEIEHLDTIFAGDIPPNPSELLGSERMRKILDTLKQQYDYIMLDTPPINLVTDAVVLAPKTDGVLFVVFANHSDRGSVGHALEQLEYVQAKILGFVLNGVQTEHSHYRYRKYGGYSRYGYGRYGYDRYGYGYYGYGHYGYGHYGYSHYGYGKSGNGGNGYSNLGHGQAYVQKPPVETENETQML